MFLVGTRKDHINNSNTNLNTCNLTNLNDCACNLSVNYNNICAGVDLQPCNFYPRHPVGSHYERLYNCNLDRGAADFQRRSLRHSVQHTPTRLYMPKSLSYAANIDRSPYQYPVHCRDYLRMSHPKPRNMLRPSKSVPEGLARWEHYRRPIIRNVQVIEQITTSV